MENEKFMTENPFAVSYLDENGREQCLYRKKDSEARVEFEKMKYDYSDVQLLTAINGEYVIIDSYYANDEE